MSKQENGGGQVTQEEALSPSEIEVRKFKIEDISYKGRVIKLVSVESKSNYVKNRDLVPDNWREQISNAMEDTSLVFVSYFPPELERTAYHSRLYGRYARHSGKANIHDIYQPVADLAALQEKQVAVADIANKAAYLKYEWLVPNTFALGWGESAGAVEITKSEKYIPLATDARRMFTAHGIMQEAERYPTGSSFLYVAAPAHVNRVKQYITEEPTQMDNLRYKVYRNSYTGLDKNTRIYKPTQNGWLRVSNVPIR